MSQDKLPRNRLMWGYLYKWFLRTHSQENLIREWWKKRQGKKVSKAVDSASQSSAWSTGSSREWWHELFFLKARSLDFCANTEAGEQGISYAFLSEVAPPADESLEKGQLWAIRVLLTESRGGAPMITTPAHSSLSFRIPPECNWDPRQPDK